MGCTIFVALFHVPIETIGSKFGGIPAGFPKPSIPAFKLDQVLLLFPSAMTVALLAAVESLLSAVVADSMSGTRHNSNVELVAQGIANLASPLFGGIPATGAIARTATNIRAGARTPVSGVVHALTLLMVLVIAAPLARYIPLATLAAVLFVVAYNMGEWREIGTILRLSQADIAVWAATFALTVLADLTTAVEVGMVLAALLYIYRISQTTTVVPVTQQYIRDGRAHVLQDKQLPSYVSILRIHGPFLFGTTEKLAEATADLGAFPAVVIVRLAQYDGPGCNRPARARSVRQPIAKIRQNSPAVRRARSASPAVAESGLHRAHRTGERPASRGSRLAARTRNRHGIRRSGAEMADDFQHTSL